MKRLLRVVLAAVLLLIGLGVGNPSYAASEGSITSYANAQRARAGAPALKSDATMNAVALNAAKRYAAQGSITKGENLTPQIRGGWTGTQTVRQMLTTTDPAAIYAKALTGHQTVMNGRQWTAMGSGFATAGGQTYLVLLYATYPALAAPPVTVDPVPAPAPAPVRAPAPKSVPAPVRTVAPAPVAPAPDPKPAPQPSKPPSSSPAPSKKAEPTPTSSKSAKPPQSRTAAPSSTPEPSLSPVPTIIERTVNDSGLTGEERHTLSAFLFIGAALSGTVSALSWLMVRRVSRA